MVQDALDELVGVTRYLIVLGTAAVLLAFTSGAFAESAADHAALAHGQRIVNGHKVQPTPGVVAERLRHHEEMLEAERNGSIRPLVAQPPKLAR